MLESTRCHSFIFAACEALFTLAHTYTPHMSADEEVDYGADSDGEAGPAAGGEVGMKPSAGGGGDGNAGCVVCWREGEGARRSALDTRAQAADGPLLARGGAMGGR